MALIIARKLLSATSVAARLAAGSRALYRTPLGGWGQFQAVVGRSSCQLAASATLTVANERSNSGSQNCEPLTRCWQHSMTDVAHRASAVVYAPLGRPRWNRKMSGPIRPTTSCGSTIRYDAVERLPKPTSRGRSRLLSVTGATIRRPMPRDMAAPWRDGPYPISRFTWVCF